MPHVNHDKDLQPLELPHEDPGRHKTLILRGDETDLPRPKGDVFNRLPLDLL